MGFKYINPGYGILLPNHEDYTQYTGNMTYNPDCGMAIKRGSGDTLNQTIFPLTGATGNTVYFSFCLYNNNGYWGGGGAALRSGSSNIGATNSQGHMNYLGIGNESGNFNLSTVGFYRITGSVTVGADGKFVLYVNGTKEIDAEIQADWNIAQSSLVIYQWANTCYTSNIIISDSPISPAEKVIALPVAQTAATMTDNGNGTYTATEAGQTVLQTVDTAALEAAIGADSRITGICAIANPAYYDGSGLTSLVAMEGSTEKGTISLGTDTLGGGSVSWAKDSIAISSLAGVGIGWKSAT